MSTPHIVAICVCGEHLMLVSADPDSGDIWEHTTGGDPSDFFYCSEDDDDLSPESRRIATPKDDR